VALTFTKVADAYDVWGKTRASVYDVTLDASYPANGYAITPANVGLRTIEGVMFVGSNLAAGSGGYILEWDVVNGKLLVFWPTNATPSEGPGVQVTAATDLHTVGQRCVFLGN
jgi:hypothetical protein